MLLALFRRDICDIEGIFKNLAGIFESKLFKVGNFMDRLFKKNQLNNLSYKDFLAQPLELRESLRIRDGLAEHERPLVRWPQSRVSQVVIPNLSHFWVSNN